jgi:hypothetical protein
MGIWDKIGSREELAAPALWKRKMKCREIKDCEEQVEFTYRYMYLYGLQACGGSQGQVLQHVQCALHVGETHSPRTSSACKDCLFHTNQPIQGLLTDRSEIDNILLGIEVGQAVLCHSSIMTFPMVNIQQSTISLILMRQIHYKNLEKPPRFF